MIMMCTGLWFHQPWVEEAEEGEQWAAEEPGWWEKGQADSST